MNRKWKDATNCHTGQHVISDIRAPECQKLTRAQLKQRDRAAAVCCTYVPEVHSAVVRTLFQTSGHSAVVTKVVAVCAQCSECQREEI